MIQKPKFTVQTGDWATLAAHALAVRLKVFVQEQLVPLEMEVDEWDLLALHAVVFDQDGAALATGRLVSKQPGNGAEPAPSASSSSNCTIGQVGRVAVLAACRGQRLGWLVMTTLIQAAKERGLMRLTLHAQQAATGFYEQFGFCSVGEAFEEAGIPHIEMWR